MAEVSLQTATWMVSADCDDEAEWLGRSVELVTRLVNEGRGEELVKVLEDFDASDPAKVLPAQV